MHVKWFEIWVGSNPKGRIRLLQTQLFLAQAVAVAFVILLQTNNAGDEAVC